MELRVQILPGSEVNWEIGNNTFKSLMIANTKYSGTGTGPTAFHINWQMPAH